MLSKPRSERKHFAHTSPVRLIACVLGVAGKALKQEADHLDEEVMMLVFDPEPPLVSDA